jgi:hypothetical protein
VTSSAFDAATPLYSRIAKRSEVWASAPATVSVLAPPAMFWA